MSTSRRLLLAAAFLGSCSLRSNNEGGEGSQFCPLFGAWAEVTDETELEEKRSRCKAQTVTTTYDVVDSYEPAEMANCGEEYVTDIMGSNVEVVDISTIDLTDNNKLVMLAERKGPLHLLNVVVDGDNADWDIETPEERTFRGNSCQNVDKFCDIAKVHLATTGFWTVDRHRVTSFNFSYSPEMTETIIGQMGNFNTAPQEEEDFYYPTNLAFYSPYNSTYISEDTPINPFLYDAKHDFLLVSDSGSHRIMLFNLTLGIGGAAMDFVAQFGLTGEPTDDSTGLHLPHGLAVSAPAVEVHFEPVFANIFVADRLNDRLVKLNLGYPTWEDAERATGLTLMWGGEYGGVNNKVRYNETLVDPLAVCMFRYYIMVAEAGGNSVSILKVHHSDLTKFVFVSRLTPVSGIQMTGNMAVTEAGYLWYTYVDEPATYGVASIFFDEWLRETPKRDMIYDFVSQCQNDTWYHVDVLANESLYLEVVGYILNATATNWLYPDLPGWIDIYKFNMSTYFDLDTLNVTILGGLLEICAPAASSTTPAMLSGDSDGWAGQSSTVTTAGASEVGPTNIFSHSILIAFLVLWAFAAAS